MVEDRKEGRGKWWQVSKILPAEVLDIVFLVVAGLSVIFLILMIVGFGVASGRGGRLKEVEEKLGQTEAQLKAATELPPAAAPPPKPVVIEKGENVEEIRAKVNELNASLAQMNKEKTALRNNVDELTKTKTTLTQEVERLNNELKAAREEIKTLKKKAEEGEQSSKKVDALTKSLKEVRDELAARVSDLKKCEVDITRAKKDIETLTRDAETAAARYKSEIATRDKRIADLDQKLAEFPKTPLTSAQAEIKYREIVEQAKPIMNPDDRIAHYFRGMMALAGTQYEPKAKALWEQEKAAKEKAIDTAAAAVSKEAQAKVKSQAAAHEENIKVLEAALEKVKGTRHEATVKKLLDKERGLLEEAAKKVQEGAAPTGAK